MPEQFNDVYLRAIRTGEKSNLIYETISISHPALPNTQYFVYNSSENITATLEDGSSAEFVSKPFEIDIPDENQRGRPTGQIRISNVAGNLLNYLRMLSHQAEDATLTYRPYAKLDLSKPGIKTPPQMQMFQIIIKRQTMTARLDQFDLSGEQVPGTSFIADDGFPLLEL